MTTVLMLEMNMSLWPMLTPKPSLSQLSFLEEVKPPGPDTIHNEVLRPDTTTSLFHHLARFFYLFHPIRLHPNCMENSHPPYVAEA